MPGHRADSDGRNFLKKSCNRSQRFSLQGYLQAFIIFNLVPSLIGNIKLCYDQDH